MTYRCDLMLENCLAKWRDYMEDSCARVSDLGLYYFNLPTNYIREGKNRKVGTNRLFI